MLSTLTALTISNITVTEIHGVLRQKLLKCSILRCQIHSESTSYSMGTRFDIYNIIVDYGFNTRTIDATHHFSIGYKF